MMQISANQSPINLFTRLQTTGVQALAASAQSVALPQSQDMFQKTALAFAGKNVRPGETAHAQDDETLSTHGLSDCSSFTFLKNYDPKKRIYRDRAMSHVLGSNLSFSTGGHNSAGAEICSLVDQARQERGPFKLILAYGDNNKSDFSHTMFKEQSYQGREPFLECLNLPNLIFEEHQMPTCGHTIEVNPEGKVKIYK